MIFNNKLDFCIMPNPSGGGFTYLVFISIRGTNKVDDTLCSDPDYEILVQAMENRGFEEIDSCAFESKSPVNTKEDLDKLTKSVLALGIKYSKPLEFNILSEFHSLRSELGQINNLENQEDEYLYFSNNEISIGQKQEVYNIKNKVPNVGEKIKLNFYLFLQCIFKSENDVFLELIGDLYSSKNSNEKNYLQIASSDFIRLSSSTTNTIILQSSKTYKDFLQEIDFLFKGSFKYNKNSVDQNGNNVLITKEFLYNILEIKKHVNPNHRIVVEVSLNKFYDDMIEMSKNIRKEYLAFRKKTLNIDTIKTDMFDLKEKLNGKMLNYAETDEFEKANYVKKDINFIENKIQLVENLEEKIISNQEYSKNFCMNY